MLFKVCSMLFNVFSMLYAFHCFSIFFYFFDAFQCVQCFSCVFIAFHWRPCVVLCIFNVFHVLCFQCAPMVFICYCIIDILFHNYPASNLIVHKRICTNDASDGRFPHRVKNFNKYILYTNLAIFWSLRRRSASRTTMEPMNFSDFGR